MKSFGGGSHDMIVLDYINESHLLDIKQCDISVVRTAAAESDNIHTLVEGDISDRLTANKRVNEIDVLLYQVARLAFDTISKPHRY